MNKWSCFKCYHLYLLYSLLNSFSYEHFGKFVAVLFLAAASYSINSFIYCCLTFCMFICAVGNPPSCFFNQVLICHCVWNPTFTSIYFSRFDMWLYTTHIFIGQFIAHNVHALSPALVAHYLERQSAYVWPIFTGRGPWFMRSVELFFQECWTNHPFNMTG